MTPEEYVQLKAFARVDGAFLSLLWILSFAFYLIGISNPMYSMAALLLMIVTPFFVGRRLCRFRDEDRQGIISFGRSWAYSILVFFYAAILLAVVQYIYFAYMDQGYLLAKFSSIMTAPENQEMIRQYGMQQAINDSLKMMEQMRPIDYALNVLTMNILLGIFLGLPIAALTRRDVAANGGQDNQQIVNR